MVYIFAENNKKTITVEELIAALQRYDQDKKVFLRMDGSIFGLSEESVCCSDELIENSDELIENYASQP